MKRDDLAVRSDGVGARLLRKEDHRFLTGTGTYIDDVTVPNVKYLAVVRSTHAHARILHIDSKGLNKSFPDVDLITAKDIPPNTRIPIRIAGGAQFAPYLQPPLAEDKVRYVGEPVAVVIARTSREAEEASEAVEVAYELLPPVLDCEGAVAEGVVKIHEAGNCATKFILEKGDAIASLKDAPIVLDEHFFVHRHTGMPMEPRGLVAVYDRGTGRLRVWGPTKLPYVSRAILSRLLKLSEQQISFVEPDVGGSFGVRGEFYPEDFLVPFAAIRLGVAVKWVETRREHFVAINHSREQKWRVRIGATREGKLLAIAAYLFNDTGAYVRTHGTIVAHHSGTSLPGPYWLANYRCEITCSITNKTPTGTMRAPGMFEATFVRERALDMLAKKLDIDPVELRRRNFIAPEQMPYLIYPNWHGPYKPLYDSGKFAEIFHKTLEAIKAIDEEDPLPADAGAIRYGTGISCAVEPSGLGPYERARIRVDVDGHFYVFVGVTSQGQGQETTFAQICAETLGVPASDITVRHGSTDEMPTGYGTNASRGAVMGGKAVYMACQSLLQKARVISATKLMISEEQIQRVAEGFKGADASNTILTWRDLALSMSPLAFLHGGATVPGFELSEGLEAFAHAGNVAEGTSVFSVHWARVAVDTDTGEVNVLKYLVSCDIGRALNPMIVEGQLHGGVAMGLGGTLSEELIYDEHGQLLTGSFMDYACPRAADVPEIHTLVFEDSIATTNPLGVKGVGEVGTSGVGAAIANAVANVLGKSASEVRALPLNSRNVRKLIVNAG